MGILITGGAGYIGSHTCAALLKAGKEIVVMDNFYNSSPEAVKRITRITGKEFPFYERDLLDKDGVRGIFRDHKIDSVIHFAGMKSAPESVSIPLQYYRNNIDGTLTLCEVMDEFGARSLVFSSSATVYGLPSHMPCTEDMPIGGCTNPYGQTKFMIELILKDLYTSDNRWGITVLRYFNPLGADKSGLIGENPRGIPNNVMPYITQVAVGKLECLKVTGSDYDTPDGTGVRDYVHVEDLARGHLLALDHMAVGGGYYVYNLGTGKGTSVLELIHSFEEASGRKIPFVFTDRRPGDIALNYAGVEKAKKELGFTAEFDIKRMCEDSWRWQSMNPDGI